MTDRYTAARLNLAQVEQAFPLLHLAAPEVSLAQWHKHAQALLRAQAPTPAGIIAVRAPLGYISGLFAYQVGSNLVCGRTLEARDVVAAGIGLRALTAAMVDAMTALAGRHDCGAIHARVLGAPEHGDAPPSMIWDSLCDAGFEPCDGQLCKRLGGESCRRERPNRH